MGHYFYVKYYLCIREVFKMSEGKDLVQPDTLDLGANRDGQLNETILSAMGSQIKMMLSWIFGDNVFFPENVKGTRSEIDSFMKALRGERNYMHAYKRHGLGDKRTYNNKYKLDKAVQGFEKTTKLKWPFK